MFVLKLGIISNYSGYMQMEKLQGAPCRSTKEPSKLLSSKLNVLIVLAGILSMANEVPCLSTCMAPSAASMMTLRTIPV